jgi:hypothetical protein
MPRSVSKEVDQSLFKHASQDIVKLNKQARAELRLKQRKLWKEKNLDGPHGPKLT